MFILFENWDARYPNDYDLMGYTTDEEFAMNWVAKNPDFRKYQYCPNKDLSEK